MQALADNVYFDASSAHEWSALHETTFLERVLDELRASMGETFEEHDFYVLSTQDPHVRPESATRAGPRKILIYISDELATVPNGLQPHYLAIFKAYLPRELPGTNTFPFNLGYVRDVPACPVTPLEQRSTNVFFSGNLNLDRLPLYRALHPLYRRLPEPVLRVGYSVRYREIASRHMPADLSRAFPGSYIRFTGGFMKGLPPAEYGRKLADSRIVLCPQGSYGPETFRHVEAMRAGAVVASQHLPQTHFYRGSPIVTVNDWREGVRTVEEMLLDPSALKSLQEETVRWWNDVCSEAATAKYMHEKIQKASASGGGLEDSH